MKKYWVLELLLVGVLISSGCIGDGSYDPPQITQLSVPDGYIINGTCIEIISVESITEWSPKKRHVAGADAWWTGLTHRRVFIKFEVNHSSKQNTIVAFEQSQFERTSPLWIQFPLDYPPLYKPTNDEIVKAINKEVN